MSGIFKLSLQLSVVLLYRLTGITLGTWGTILRLLVPEELEGGRLNLPHSCFQSASIVGAASQLGMLGFMLPVIQQNQTLAHTGFSQLIEHSKP